MNDSIDALLASNHRLFQDGLIMARRLDELEPRVARLEGALRDARECGEDGDWQSARRIIDAALEQESSDGLEAASA